MSGHKKRDFRWRRFPPVQVFLYLLVRVVIMVLDMFPWSMAPKIAGTLGWILRTVDRKHARIARKNLENTPDLVPPEEIPAFIHRMYGHVGRGFVEMLMLPRMMQRAALTRYVRFEGLHHVDRALRRGKGAIVAIGHLGNWELIGLAVTMAGYPLNSLARPVENPWLDRYLNRFRTQTGQRIIPKYHALGSMVRVLQRNENLVIQIDQDARHSGVFVRFFGRPASTHRSPAVLALKYGTPVLVIDIYREGELHHCVVTEPIDPADYRDASDPVRALTQAYTTRFEECVRRHPEQWFWMHDRWKTAERVARVDAEAVSTV